MCVNLGSGNETVPLVMERVPTTGDELRCHLPHVIRVIMGVGTDF